MLGIWSYWCSICMLPLCLISGHPILWARFCLQTSVYLLIELVSSWLYVGVLNLVWRQEIFLFVCFFKRLFHSVEWCYGLQREIVEGSKKVLRLFITAINLAVKCQMSVWQITLGGPGSVCVYDRNHKDKLQALGGFCKPIFLKE